ncbi:hypothetical protein BS50DRAFT_680612 [Corynespora cassiicola Philippines]|uniref:Myb-like domain-containing protein n=1 Tax=Corynespora cassiicola Philippines TaxID=1448308 RepID=A0A2T2N8A0_CORCC|nr:hypothetical protein BS50DRAFT_680612 [Corynespora cassiicola Philippines]
MAYNDSPNRRISLGYVLGLRKEPFKGSHPSPPLPSPKPCSPRVGGFRDMLTLPGGPIEWAASDGRKGTLSGNQKARLTTANLEKVPTQNTVEVPMMVPPHVAQAIINQAGSNKASSKGSKPADKKDDDLFGGIDGIFGDNAGGGSANNSPKSKKDKSDANKDSKDKGNKHGFTKEQDDKIMEMKNANGGVPWADIATEIGMPENQCKERFKQIKPTDWRPNNTKGKGDGKGNSKNQNQEKKDEKKDEATGGDAGNTDNGWDFGAPADTGVTKDNQRGNDNNGGGDGGWNSNNTGGGGGDSWGSNNGGDTGGWNTDNNNATGFDNTGGGFDATAIPTWGGDNSSDQQKKSKAGSKAGSNKNSPSQAANDNTAFPAWGIGLGQTSNKGSKKGSNHGSKKGSKKGFAKAHSSSSRSHAGGSVVVLQVEPDDVFDEEDLKLIARIMKKDTHGLWQRVASRFRDKTGRNLHPDVFEKKVLGTVKEGKREIHAPEMKRKSSVEIDQNINTVSSNLSSSGTAAFPQMVLPPTSVSANISAEALDEASRKRSRLNDDTELDSRLVKQIKPNEHDDTDSHLEMSAHIYSGVRALTNEISYLKRKTRGLESDNKILLSENSALQETRAKSDAFGKENSELKSRVSTLEQQIKELAVRLKESELLSVSRLETQSKLEKDLDTAGKDRDANRNRAEMEQKLRMEAENQLSQFLDLAKSVESSK